MSNPNVYYRNRELYTLSWNISNLQNYIISISKFTKTIALHKYKTEINDIKDSTIATDIEIYTGSGNLLHSINWNNHVNGRIIDLGWTIDEKLVVLLQNGHVRVYYDFEGGFNEYSVGYDAQLIGVKSFKVVRNVIFIILNDFKLIYIDLTNNISIHSKVLKDIRQEITGDSLKFRDWDIIIDDESFEILISINKEIYSIPKFGNMVKKSIDGPFHKISISSNNQFVSLYHGKLNKIFVVTSNFNKSLFDFQLDSNQPPVSQINWCGSDAIALGYYDTLKLIAPGGSIDFYLNPDYQISNELDGLTILNESSLEFLSKVANETVECFKIGSTSKSSILLDSVDKLNKHSPKANENLTIIGSDENLNHAVKTCISASLEEFDSYWQKKLLKAVSFGKSSLELKSEFSNTRHFLKTCDDLRILNNIRSPEVGLFLTSFEYNHLGIETVIKLLVKRQQFYEAFQISKFLKLPIDLIFINWACVKIKYNPNLNDEELSQQITTKFQTFNNNSYISFESIATTAFQEGRSNLAKILINFESLFTKQIPLLLTMEEHELALQKACDSQDTDLLLETLLILKQTLSLPVFFKLLNHFKIASNCFEFFFTNDEVLIFDFLNQADRTIDIANYDLKKTLTHTTQVPFEKQIEVLNKAINAYSLMRKNSNDHKQLEKQLKLLQLQDSYTNEFNIEFQGLSIVGTLEKLILLNQNNKINAFMKNFKISEKKFQYIKLNFLIKNEKFDELYEWSNNQKLSIGSEPIIQKLISSNQSSMALKLIHRSNLSYSNKMEYLIKLKDFKNVIEEAFHKKDLELLERIEMDVETPRLKELLQDYKSKLQTTTRFF
ncbi:Vacuolar protein sorting-associated protein [Wickerhamomyces ciferrii]|uniref:Probable vacuolar protein sorting-associated protein 16 homolog n=1 Tax=Wickerhamomyces ciferrii (strain ATCC 14091 / BCRC 22168 / CBS 111 / JCM 3599 / NBRC 0793 / NRRL Y-1031 F-60-10) TaxID=1206466 RepID=K0KM74_WICCF|nr:Vacuolar protein sorting-associated protein [Wickerhamomyces ciferrii]CCH43282.1 Vacuolar protein sorting-associated protein [Wickerhamomyces ciferrii]